MTDDPPSFGIDLPARFRRLLSADAERFAALYNALQGMDATEFEAVFGDSLAVLRRAADADAPELVAVLGLGLDGGTVVDASVLSVYSRDDGRVLYAAETPDVPDTGDHTSDETAAIDAPDAAVYVPVRSDDFPPGSDESVADLDVESYREVVASMVYLRYQLSEGDADRYDDLYRRPLAKGLAAYVP